MIQIKKLVVFSSVLLSMCAFAQEELRIKGHISGIANDAIVSLNADKQQKEVVVRDGKFEVNLPLDAPTSVYLYVQQENEFKYAFFFLGNEEVVIEGSIEDFPMNIQAKNSKHDLLRYQEYQLTGALQNEIDQLEEEAYELMQSGASKDSLYEVYMGVPNGKITVVNEKISAQSFDFIQKNINTDYGRFILKFNTTSFTKNQFKALLQKVEPQYKNTKEIQFIQHLVDYPALEQGSKYYDFTAEDIEGKEVKFNTFFDGKYVLLDFSTWFCGYCQQAAPKTAVLAENLKKELNYVTYYVGDDAESLQQYYELKGNKGTILWTKAGEYHSTIAKYRQTGTPHYLLFDTKGNLIQEFEGADENLEEKVRELIQG